MGRNTRSTTYDKEFVHARDDHPRGPELRAYRSARSRTLDTYSLAEDPTPLFLSNDPSERIQRGFGSGGERKWKTAVVLRRVFKTGLLAATAAAIALAIVSLDDPLAMFANAKASLMGSSADQPAATSHPLPTTVALASAAPPVTQPTNDKALPTAAKVTPRRDDIALALRSARPNQAETDQPVTAPPARKLHADEVAALLKRAKGLIAIGDFAPARLLLERVGDAQEPAAALLLAQTYDPAVLGTADLRTITSDPARARDWYQKAAQLGSVDARQRLAQMQK
jgi:TPR repeat protein